MPSLLELLPEELLFEVIPYLDCRSIKMVLEAYPVFKRHAIIITAHHYNTLFFKGSGIKRVHIPYETGSCISCPDHPSDIEFYNQMIHKHRIKLIEMTLMFQPLQYVISSKEEFCHPPNLSDPSCFVYADIYPTDYLDMASGLAKYLNELNVKWCSGHALGFHPIVNTQEDKEAHESGQFEVYIDKTPTVPNWSPLMAPDQFNGVEYLSVEGVPRFSDMSFPNLKELFVCVSDCYETLMSKIGQPHGELKNLSLPVLKVLKIHYHEMLPAIWRVVIGQSPKPNTLPKLDYLEIGDIRLLDRNGPSFGRYGSRQRWTRDKIQKHIDPMFTKQFKRIHTVQLAGTPDILLKYWALDLVNLIWVKFLEEPKTEEQFSLSCARLEMLSVTVRTSDCTMPTCSRLSYASDGAHIDVLAPRVNIKGFLKSMMRDVSEFCGASRLRVHRPLRVIQKELSSEFDDICSSEEWNEYFEFQSRTRHCLKDIEVSGYSLPFLFSGTNKGEDPLDLGWIRNLEFDPLIRMKDVSGQKVAKEMDASNTLILNGLSGLPWSSLSCTPMLISEESRVPLTGIESTIDFHIRMGARAGERPVTMEEGLMYPQGDLLETKSSFRHFYLLNMPLENKSSNEWRERIKEDLPSWVAVPELIDPRDVEAHQWHCWKLVLDAGALDRHQPVPAELRMHYIPLLRIPSVSRFGVYGAKIKTHMFNKEFNEIRVQSFDEEDFVGVMRFIKRPPLFSGR